MAADTEAGIIDAHVHIWDRGRFHYHWLEPGSPLDRNFDLADLQSILSPLGVRGAILMEATNTEAEIEWLLAQINAHAGWGVIGWIDPRQQPAAEVIHHYAQNKRFKGIRLNWFQISPDLAVFEAAMRALAAEGLVLDVLLDHAYVTDVLALAERCPDNKIVLEHFAGITLQAETLSAWRETLQAACALPNIFFKLSGYPAHNRDLPVTVLRDFVGLAIEKVSSSRLLFGSNYPICEDYRSSLLFFRAAVTHFEQADQQAILIETARSLYGLQPPS